MKKYLWMIIVIVFLLIVAVIINETINKNKRENVGIKTTITTTTKKEVNLMDGVSLNYHASIRIEKAGMIIYFDPLKIETNNNDANYIFITHSYYDHYSALDIKKVMNEETKFIITSDLLSKVKSLGVKEENITVVNPGESYVVDEVKFDTIASYNTNKNHHPKANNWVGYNVMIDGYNYYVVGDSDATEELKQVKCDVIFIPVGGTYTMTAKEAVEAVNVINIKYAIPIHYGETGSSANANEFVDGLNANIKGVIVNETINKNK